jgi:serine/threonine protein kinase
VVGKTISHYRVIEKLGGGGMGVVYKAQDLKLDRLVALKFLPSHIGQDAQEKQRFIHEAKAASALDHTNICNIHEIDETDEGQLFICMAYYEGETLKKKIEKGILKIEDAINITIQISEGLCKAHQKDIIHRDIKPANIMITEDGIAKIVDFGLAKLAGQTKITKAGTTLGTVAYMSPEQIQGEEVDQRTDIWSLGVVLYEMLTGRIPFNGEYDSALMYSILNQDPESIRELCPNISSEMIQVLDRLLEKDPTKRYQSVNEILIILESVKRDPENKYNPSIKNIRESVGNKSTKFFTIPKKRFWIVAFVVAILIFLFVNQEILQKSFDKPNDQKISIAVMPFKNLTGDTLFNIWQEGLPKLFVTLLSTSYELSVIDVLESMGQEQFSRSGSILPTEISSKSNVENLLQGDILLAGNKLRIQVRMQDARSGEVLKSEMIDGSTQDDIFEMVENISYRLKNFFEIKMIEQGVKDYEFRNVLTNSAKAYRYYLRGMEAFNKQDQKNARYQFHDGLFFYGLRL